MHSISNETKHSCKMKNNNNTLLWILFLFLYTSVCIECGRVGKWLAALEDEGYDGTLTPTHGSGQPTNVTIRFFVESLGNFRVLSMDYNIDIYFIETWTDPRLSTNVTDCFQFYRQEYLDKIWHPDVYFANSKEARYNEVVVPNRIMKICPGGDVRFSVRIAVTLSCYMNLKAYPLDHQTCHVKMLPYGNTIKTMTINWTETSPIQIHENITEADLELVGYRNTICNGSYFGAEYSCLLGEFYLSRTKSQSILQVYVPSLSIVIISWISFWIDPASVPGRTGLAVTTLLTLATQATGISLTLPPVGYVKAIDVWLSVCLLFLFGSLIEFTIVNTYTRKWNSIAAKSVVHRGVKGFPLITGSDENQEIIKAHLCRYYRKKAIVIDQISRVAFPLAFLIFLLSYWLYFLSLEPESFVYNHKNQYLIHRDY